ncbi:MAG: polysaccharide deacetylase family protein [Tissierellaceae bacterium]
MPDYPGKLLELKGIEHISNDHYLHIRLHHQQDFDILWKVDEFTADNIKTIFKEDSPYRYRLSFSKSKETQQDQYLGILTQTFRDKSEQFFFSCSLEYMDDLNHIRKCENIVDLNETRFRNIDLSPLKNAALGEKQVATPKIPRKRNYKIAYYSIALFALVGLIFWKQFLPIGSKASINEEVSAQSADPIELSTFEEDPADISPKEDRLEETEDLDTDMVEDEVIEEIEEIYVDKDIPFLELEKLKTYEIPKGMVAITFDDGPSIYSKRIVDTLNEYQIGATFFTIGRNVKKYPDELKYIHDNGYSIGSHTMNHVNLAKSSQDKQEEEVNSSMDLLREITGVDHILIRPPYGSFNKGFERLIEENQYKIVLWNNDPEDWKVQNADKIFHHIKNTRSSGAIILLHETKPVADALPRIIEYLQGLELEIVSLK